MHDTRGLLTSAGVAVAGLALTLAGCANLPVGNYADAAPAGYYSPDYGYYVADDYYDPEWFHHPPWPSTSAHVFQGGMHMAYGYGGHFGGEGFGAHGGFGGGHGGR